MVLAIPAHADDCAPIAEAMIAAARQPHGVAIATLNPGKPEDYGQAITTANRLYIQANGVWQSMPYAPEATIAQINAASAQASCAHLGDEALGEATARVFSSHSTRAGRVSNARIWIDAKTGLPLKTDQHFQDGMAVSQTFRYDNVQPPAGMP